MGAASRSQAPSKVAHPGWGVQGAALDEVAAASRGWRLELTQLAPGEGAGNLHERELPSLHLGRVRFTTSVAVHSRAVAPERPFQIGIVSAVPERFVWQGRTVRRDHLMVSDGGSESHLVLPKACEFLVARLDRRRLGALADALHGPRGEPADPRIQLRRLPADAVEALRVRLNALMEEGSMERTDASEVALGDLYQQVALALATPNEPVRPSPETRRRALRRAEEFIRAHVRDRLSLADLCLAAECSERTLRNVFHERYGLSPAAFLKRLRLQGLRRDLLHATPRSTTVLDLALRWGFWHLGHLGRDYKTFFGETPAMTLRRPAHPSGPGRR